jgi:protocatechuate 3,4-dioxygenase beta subunit
MNPSPNRRHLLIASAATLAAPAWLSSALAQTRNLRPTPSQTEGPF